MPDAELEISIQCRASDYHPDARFTSPDHNVQPAVEVPLALDLATLGDIPRTMLGDEAIQAVLGTRPGKTLTVFSRKGCYAKAQ